jgi:hypothetical protein
MINVIKKLLKRPVGKIDQIKKPEEERI